MITGEVKISPDNENKRLEGLTDHQLLLSSLDKNYYAFAELVRRYEGRIYRLGLKMLHSPDDAEDLLQKTFLSVFENMHRFRGESKVSTWIFRIATNHALMKLRKEKREKNDQSLDAPISTGQDLVYPQLVDEDACVPEIFEKQEMLKALEEAVVSLPDIYRLVFILRDIEGFSNKEVAQMLNLSVPAVKSRILRARLHLRDHLNQMQKGGDELEKSQG